MTTDKRERKARPIARGVLDYFPDAIAEVAHVSFVGNQQHNPGEPMHWAKDKSPDHADCIARHLTERGTLDDDGLRHSAKVAWRALAMLQIELEQEGTLAGVSCNCTAADPCPNGKTGTQERCEVKIDNRTVDPSRRGLDLARLINMGCPALVAKQIADGISYPAYLIRPSPYVYIAGPMRGYPEFNFPAFDAARNRFTAREYNVISPADIDRASHPNANDPRKVDTTDQTVFAFRDFCSLYFIARLEDPRNGIVLLPGWEQSTGASAEFFLARWLGLKIYDKEGNDYPDARHRFALAHCAARPSVAELTKLAGY